MRRVYGLRRFDDFGGGEWWFDGVGDLWLRDRDVGVGDVVFGLFCVECWGFVGEMV